MSWSLLLLIAAIAAIVWIVRGRRPATPTPAAPEPAPVATDWGRPPPTQGQQPGMGGQVMGGLATGLAIGAGALAAQEIGRHLLGADHSQHGLGSVGDPHAGGSAAGTDLARDAGLGSVGNDDTASWDDGGGAFGGDDGGGGDS